MKDDRREEAPNVQLWSREGFGGPLSVLVRPTNGTEYISVQGPHAPRRAVLERMVPADLPVRADGKQYAQPDRRESISASADAARAGWDDQLCSRRALRGRR